MALQSLDLLDLLRAALDEVEPTLDGRAVDIEMPRVRVLADPHEFVRDFAALVATVLVEASPAGALVVHVTRTGKTARIDVADEGGAGPIASMTVSLAAGASGAGDA
jgi:signal transduction histidine kinase